MMDSRKSRVQLLAETQDLRNRLEEAESTLQAIRNGDVDALVVHGEDGVQVFTLKDSDRPYRLLIEEMKEGAVTLTSEGTIIYCNRHFSDLLQIPLEKVIGSSIHQFIPSQHDAAFRSLLNLGLSGTSQGEISLARSEAQPVPVFLSLNPLIVGEEPGVCLVVTDLTEQKVHEKVSAAEVLARSILEQAAEAIVVCDPRGMIIRASNAAHRLGGVDPVGRMFDQAFPLKSPRTPSEDCPETSITDQLGDLSEGPITGREFSFCRPDGVRLDVLLSAGPVIDPRGTILGRVVTLTDITDRRRMEEELRLRADELAQADRRKDEFLAMLAHELRNPLSAIGSAVALSSRENSQEHLGWAMEVIDRQIRHLTRLIDDLLDVSRITRGKIQLRKDLIDPTPIIHAAVEAVRPFVEERRHELSVSFQATGLRLLADPTRLEQILVNLLTNAAKYTEAGGRIALTIGREGRELVFRIKDNGMGIPADQVGRMFELFAQGDRARGAPKGG